MNKAVDESIDFERLGFLGRPIVFRAYVVFFTSAVVLCWTEFLVNEAFVFAGGQFLTFFVAGRRSVKKRTGLSSVTRITWQSSFLNFLFAVCADVLWHYFVRDFSWQREVQMAGWAAVASAFLYASFGLPSERDWLRLVRLG